MKENIECANDKKKIISQSDDTIKARIICFKEYLGISTRAFEQSIGVANGYLKQLKGNPSYATMTNITKAYPALSTIWLMKGVGDMLNIPQSQNSSSSSVSITSSNVMSDNSTVQSSGNEILKEKISSLESIINQKDIQIKIMEEQLSFMKKSLETKDEIIKALSSR